MKTWLWACCALLVGVSAASAHCGKKHPDDKTSAPTRQLEKSE